MITSSHLYGLGQAVSLGISSRIALSFVPSVTGETVTPHPRFLPDDQSLLSSNLEAVFTLEEPKVSLTPKHFLARRMSNSSSGTPPRSCINIGSTCHDEGSKSRGGNSDFDNPICDSSVETVSVSRSL